MTLVSCLVAVAVLDAVPNLTNAIIDQLQDDTPSLKHCSMVAKRWRERSLKWLFEAIVLRIASDPWWYVQWLGEPTQGMTRHRSWVTSVDNACLGLRLATKYAHELRLVQRPSFTWIAPVFLYPILHRFAMFDNVTSLSLDSFSVHYFDEVDIVEIFRHFFLTVRKLHLEDPRSTVNGLVWFLFHFQVLDDFSISDPKWDETDVPFVSGSVGSPPFRGELHLMGLDTDSADFISLLACIPVAFRRVSVVGCQLPAAPLNRLLNRLSPNLRAFSMSTWFDCGSNGSSNPTLSANNPNAGDRFSDVDLSPCTGVEEIRFFVAMVPVAVFPSQSIRETLVSVTSRRVQTIVLDFIVDHAVDTFDESFLRGFAGLDPQLKRIASEYEGVGKMVVKLSANEPLVLGSCLTGFGTYGILVIGSRIGGPLKNGDIQWSNVDGGR